MSYSAVVAGETGYTCSQCQSLKKKNNERVASLQYEIHILCENIHGKLFV